MIAVGFAIAAIAVLAMSFLAWRENSHRYGDAFAVSGMLFMTWCISNVLAALYSPPDCWTFYPVMDLACGIVVMSMWATKR